MDFPLLSACVRDTLTSWLRALCINSTDAWGWPMIVSAGMQNFPRRAEENMCVSLSEALAYVRQTQVFQRILVQVIMKY